MWRTMMRTLGHFARGSYRLRAELDEEIRLHLELRVRDLVAQGMAPEQARHEAERRFGDAASRQRLYTSARRCEDRIRFATWTDSLRLDTRVAWRRIRAAPAFSLLSVATLALGVGLTSTMFALLNATLLRPLPFPEPGRLVALYSVAEDRSQFPWVSSTNWLDWSEQNKSLEATALYQADRVSILTSSEAVSVPAARVGGAFFEALQPRLLVGRAFSEREAFEREPVAVVSAGFWQRFMNADPDLGEVRVDGLPLRVIGVLAANASFPERTDVWVPAVYRRLSGAGRNNINWRVIARLADNVALSEARADLDRIAASIRDQEPEGFYSWGVGVIPLRHDVIGDADQPVALLMGAVVFVLLVACANLAGHAYARSLAGVEAAAIRLALGATRVRLLQHQLVEHLLLALAGGAVGLLLASAAVGWLSSGRLPLPRAENIAIDLRVAAFSVAISAAAGILAGLLPSIRLARSAPRSSMGSVSGAAPSARAGAATILVGAEVALSVLLLIGGGLLLRSFVAFNARDLGFDPARLLVAEIELAGPLFNAPESRATFWARVLQESRTLPGVADAALANEVPGLGQSGHGVIELAGWPEGEASATYRIVSDGYFSTLGLPLLTGRDFSSLDALGTQRVVIVSSAFAEQYWPSEDPIGQYVRATSMEPVPGGAPALSVVGVVADLDSGYGLEVRPAMYVLNRQAPFFGRRMVLTARDERGHPSDMAAPLRERLRGLDGSLAAEFAPMTAHLGELQARDRLVATLLNGFALMALVLAGVGIHGLLSFAVASRTREIAVRSALGASRGRILRMVLGDALRVTATGAAVGVCAAWSLSGILNSQLTDVAAGDPLTFVIVVVTLLAVALAAAWLPARRAVRLDALDALRSS